jgi:hypothetical protein
LPAPMSGRFPCAPLESEKPQRRQVSSIWIQKFINGFDVTAAQEMANAIAIAPRISVIAQFMKADSMQ